jgi:hypothetical protein
MLCFASRLHLGMGSEMVDGEEAWHLLCTAQTEEVAGERVGWQGQTEDTLCQGMCRRWRLGQELTKSL